MLEVGAGTGALTLELARRCKRLVAVGYAPTLCDVLRRRFARTPSVEVVEADILMTSLPDGEYVAFGDIPFSRTAAIVRRLTDASDPPRDAYLAWSSDSRSVIAHVAAGLTVFGLPEDASGTVTSDPVNAASSAYSAPAFAPSDNRYAFMDSRAGRSVVEVASSEDGQRMTVTRAQRAAFEWAPDGTRLAVLKDGRGPLTYRELVLVSADGAIEAELLQGELLSFWWAPDGSALVVAELHPDVTGALLWRVIDVASGETTLVTEFAPTAAFAFALQFFDQFADSHQIWSPDSRRIVLAGAILDADTRAKLETRRFDEITPGIWVFEASEDSQPLKIADGSTAFWSPR